MKAFKTQKNLSEDAWLTGCNYDHNFLKEGRHPNREVLDQISTENPVLLIHASSHMGVTNSKGLQLQGIDVYKRQKEKRFSLSQTIQEKESGKLFMKQPETLAANGF